MKKYYDRIIADCEHRAENFILNQIIDKNSAQYGGYVKEANMAQPKMTIYGVTALMALYYTEKSKYYKDKAVYERIAIALDYVAAFQRSDGTFDLLDCNFYSAPDTAFCIKRMIPSYRFLAQRCEGEDDRALLGKMLNIIKKAAEGIANGGFHTPNHRWAIASVLMACGNILDDEKYRNRARLYLNEGIDCSESGEFAERSSGNYNRINDDAMILLYEETGDESYLVYARRNLKMMFSFFEPDGSIFTKNSTRYDKDGKYYPKDYFFAYAYLAYKDNDQVFSAAAGKIMDDIIRRGGRTPDCLSILMSHPELLNSTLTGSSFPERNRFENGDSGIVRIRKDRISSSIIAKTPHFLYFQVGAAVVGVRIGLSYFEHREFSSQTIERTENGYRLKMLFSGWFYLPFNEKPETNDWWEMDNSARDKLKGPQLTLVAEITEVEGGLDLHLCTEGCDRVPVKVELGVESGCFIKTDGFMNKSRAGSKVVIRSGMVEISKDSDCIAIGPAFGNHFFVGGKDDEDDSNPAMYNIYFTDYTCFDRTIQFREQKQRFIKDDTL